MHLQNLEFYKWKQIKNWKINKKILNSYLKVFVIVVLIATFFKAEEANARLRIVEFG